MGEHKHINTAGQWDMSQKDQIAAMTQGRLTTSESQQRVKEISRYLLESQLISTGPFPATTRVIRGFEKR